MKKEHNPILVEIMSYGYIAGNTMADIDNSHETLEASVTVEFGSLWGDWVRFPTLSNYFTSIFHLENLCLEGLLEGQNSLNLLVYSTSAIMSCKSSILIA